LAAAAVGFAALTATADELQTVEQKICTAWSKHKSIRAKLTTEMQMEQPGQKMESKGAGTYEMLRKGEKLLSRVDLKSTTTQKMGDQEMKIEQSVLVVVDGEYAYALSETSMEFQGEKTPPQKTATKSAIDPQMSGDPKLLFEHFRKDHELKLLPEQTVSGRKSFAIEATPKDRSPDNPIRSMVMCFDAETGCMNRMVVNGPDGKPMQTTTYSDAEFNVDLDPQRFAFKAPEGVEMMDLTKGKP